MFNLLKRNKDTIYSPTERLGEYSIVRKLGEGRYGISYLAEKNGDNFVIKQLKKRMLKKNEKKVFYETEILQKLDNKITNIPRLIDTFETDNTKAYVLEYKKGTTFEDLLCSNYVFNRKEIYDICEKLIHIIEQLHKQNIVHKDIRTPNIVYNNNELALIDFGLARYVDNIKYTFDLDFWYLGDFLLHLFYSSYKEEDNSKSKPWYEELDLFNEEKLFLKRLLKIDNKYNSIEEVKKDFSTLKNNSEIRELIN